MNILIVDDSKAFRHVLTGLLKEFGYETFFNASNMEEAKNVLKAVQSIGLIFSDLNMPGGSGLDFLKYIRSTPDLSGIPFVMITSDQEKKYIVEAVKYYIQSYILKPVQRQTLFQKLNDMIESKSITPPAKAPQIQ